MEEEKNNNLEEETPNMGCDCSQCPLGCGEVIDTFDEEYVEEGEDDGEDKEK